MMRCRNVERAAVFVVLVAVASPVRAQIDTTQTDPVASARATGAELRLLDVPFVPQSKVLCGGAALAMVMRFWGERSVAAESFAGLAGRHGIRASDLERAARAGGWRALPFVGGLDEARLHLRRGRPVVALLREGLGANHYVVLVGIGVDRVVLHDPSRGPFRVVDTSKLERAWRHAGSWGLLVLPSGDPLGPSHKPPAPEPPDASPEVGSTCSSLVASGVERARGGDLDDAQRLLETAHATCPDAAAPFAELAGIRFLRGHMTAAESLAARAVRLAPADAYACQLLATILFVNGKKAAALAAWNRVHEPRIDLTRIDGLDRTRYDVVANLVALPPGSMLTDAALRRSRRRLDALPTPTSTAVTYEPLPGGVARVDVDVLERRAWTFDRANMGVAAVHALVDREAKLELASPTGAGELWTARWRWWHERPALEARAELPRGAEIWRLQALWERQAFLVAGASRVHLERRRAELACSRWATADLRWEIGTALERWTGRGHDAAIEVGVERRALHDRLALCGTATQTWSLDGNPSYPTASFGADWRSSAIRERRMARVLGRVGLAAAGSHAPWLLWPGARSDILLRAHPVLDDDGTLRGPALARRVAHGGVEAQIWPWEAGPVRLGIATFVDVAKPWSSLAGGTSVHADAGVGLRFGLAGRSEVLRLDLARGARDGATALNLALQVDRSFVP
jgi:hypothetical protein